MADTIIFLTTPGAGSWTVPDDCQSATIECIGGGGNGNINYFGGGGGGAYSKKNSLSVVPGASINYQVGAAATDTWFKSTSDVLAKTGLSPTANYGGGLGGQASAGVGDVKYSGGNGGDSTFVPGYGYDGGGGGGAAGLNGAGGDGSSSTGGTGDNTYGGVGGTNYIWPAVPGGNGTEWDSTHGSGGGAGGARVNNYSGATSAGNYGAGGGGRRSTSSDTWSYGTQGLIVITYTPAVASSSSFFQLF